MKVNPTLGHFADQNKQNNPNRSAAQQVLQLHTVDPLVTVDWQPGAADRRRCATIFTLAVADMQQLVRSTARPVQQPGPAVPDPASLCRHAMR